MCIQLVHYKEPPILKSSVVVSSADADANVNVRGFIKCDCKAY